MLLLTAVQVGWAAQSNCSKKVQESKFERVTVLGNIKTHQTLCEEGNKALTQEPGGIFNHVCLTTYTLGFVSWLGVREILHEEGVFECQQTWLAPQNSASPKLCTTASSQLKLPAPAEKQTTEKAADKFPFQ